MNNLPSLIPHLISSPALFVHGESMGSSYILMNGLVVQAVRDQAQLVFIDTKGHWERFRNAPGTVEYFHDVYSADRMIGYVEKLIDARLSRMASGGVRECTDPHTYVFINELAVLMQFTVRNSSAQLKRILLYARQTNIHVVAFSLLTDIQLDIQSYFADFVFIGGANEGMVGRFAKAFEMAPLAYKQCLANIGQGYEIFDMADGSSEYELFWAEKADDDETEPKTEGADKSEPSQENDIACPRCEGKNIQSFESKDSSGSICQWCTCQKCGWRWRPGIDQYQSEEAAKRKTFIYRILFLFDLIAFLISGWVLDHVDFEDPSFFLMFAFLIAGAGFILFYFAFCRKTPPSYHPADDREIYSASGNYARYRPQQTRSRRYRTVDGELSRIDAMKGTDFEEYFARLLRRRGYIDVTVTKGSGDFGVDVIAHLNGERVLFQCKRYSQPVGVKAVQEIYAGIPHYHGQSAVVVTSNHFTDAAFTLAEETGVCLWDRGTLKQLIAEDIERENRSY